MKVLTEIKGKGNFTARITNDWEETGLSITHNGYQSYSIPLNINEMKIVKQLLEDFIIQEDKK